jgi:hypothetical protein
MSCLWHNKHIVVRDTYTILFGVHVKAFAVSGFVLYMIPDITGAIYASLLFYWLHKRGDR